MIPALLRSAFFSTALAVTPAAAEEPAARDADPAYTTTQACVKKILSGMFGIAPEELSIKRVYDRSAENRPTDYDATNISTYHALKGAGAEVIIADNATLKEIYFKGTTWISTDQDGNRTLGALPHAAPSEREDLLGLDKKLRECPVSMGMLPERKVVL